MDFLRGRTLNITDVNKHLLVEGGVFLRQIYVLNTDTDNEAKVELHNGYTTSANDLKFKTLVPKQIDQSLVVDIFDAITSSVNFIVNGVNDYIIGPLNAFTVPYPTAPFFTTGSAGDWVTFLATPNTTNLAAAIQLVTATLDPFNITPWITRSHDSDTEMAYDRNQGYTIDIPYPGIYFPQGIVAKVYDEDSASTARNTSITCVYQQAATGVSGSTIKSAYSEGNVSSGWAGETVINQPCLLHSIHFFNNASVEQGLRLYEGRDDTNELVNYKAGDNSLHQIYYPKPGFVFNPALFYKTDYASSPEKVQVTFIYQEI
jgi:hypothetical protein